MSALFEFWKIYDDHDVDRHELDGRLRLLLDRCLELGAIRRTHWVIEYASEELEFLGI